MSTKAFDIENEQAAASAFGRQSAIFDNLYSSNPIIQYKRERVRNHLGQFLHAGSYILELNAGTGEDAVWLAEQGHTVHAIDISESMLEALAKKRELHHLTQKISTELCSFTQLHSLRKKGPFDCIFSNFAGLNCTDRLDSVLSSFDPLLKPGGIVTLIILPKFCLWETLLVFKGKFKTATRRFFSRQGTKAHVEGIHFKCWYYNPSYVIRQLRPSFDLLRLEGLCTIVPPSYIEHFDTRHPRLFSFLKSKEDKLKSKWPWRSAGDYYIISFRKK